MLLSKNSNNLSFSTLIKLKNFAKLCLRNRGKQFENEYQKIVLLYAHCLLLLVLGWKGLSTWLIVDVLVLF